MKSKTRGFTPADALILALGVLLSIGVIVFFIHLSTLDVSANDGMTSVTYTVVFRDVSDDVAYSFHEGDAVVDSVKNSRIGTLLSYEILPAYTENKNGDVMTVSERTGSHDIVITVTAEAEAGGAHVDVNGTRVAVGRTMYIRTASFAGTGTCTALDTAGGH